MKVAIPEFRNRIAPVFDWSNQLIVYEINGDRDRETLSLSGLGSIQRVELLRKLGIEDMLCAGISLQMRSMVESAGIRVWDGIVGEVEEVLEAWRSGRIDQRRYAMPGCGRRRGRRRRFHGGRGFRGPRRR